MGRGLRQAQRQAHPLEQAVQVLQGDRTAAVVILDPGPHQLIQ